MEANDGPIVFKNEVCITVRAMAKYGFLNEKMNDLYNLFEKLYADNAYMCQMTVNALRCHEHNVGMRAAKKREKTAQCEDSDAALVRALSGGTSDANNADLQARDRALEQSLQQQERDFGRRERPWSFQEQADLKAAIEKSLQDQSNSDYDAELEVAKQISAQEAKEREAKEKKEAAADAQAQKPIAPISAQTSLVPSAQAVPAPIASVAQSGVAAPALVPAAPTPNPAPPVVTMPTSWWSSNKLALSVGFFTVAAFGVIAYCLQGKKGAAKTA
jgi:hypothetical protein